MKLKFCQKIYLDGCGFKGSLTVFGYYLSEELRQEGDARADQQDTKNIRKEYGFELTDRIFVRLRDNDLLRTSINNYKTIFALGNTGRRPVLGAGDTGWY